MYHCTSKSLVAQRRVPVDETVWETLEVAQLPFIDKVVDILVGAASPMFVAALFVEALVVVVEYVQPALVVEYVASARSSCAD